MFLTSVLLLIYVLPRLSNSEVTLGIMTPKHSAMGTDLRNCIDHGVHWSLNLKSCRLIFHVFTLNYTKII